MRYVTALLGLSLLGTLTLAACSKFNSVPTEKLPSSTTQGLNTAGCRVDGMVWLPLQQNLFAPEPIVARVTRTVASRPGVRLMLTLTRQPVVDGYSNANTTIELYVPRLTAVGPISLGQFVPRNVPSDWPAYASVSTRTEPSQSYKPVITRVPVLSRRACSPLPVSILQLGCSVEHSLLSPARIRAASLASPMAGSISPTKLRLLKLSN